MSHNVEIDDILMVNGPVPILYRRGMPQAFIYCPWCCTKVGEVEAKGKTFLSVALDGEQLIKNHLFIIGMKGDCNNYKATGSFTYIPRFHGNFFTKMGIRFTGESHEKDNTEKTPPK